MYTPQDEQRIYHTAKALLTQQDFPEPEVAIAALSDVLRYADWKYYVHSNPVLADVEYDQLLKLLRRLEGANPELLRPDSPTQRVAQGLTERFPQVAHLAPMLSLDNTYNAEDLLEWDRKVRAGSGGEAVAYCVEPKYDGASISLIYGAGGSLERGATRGDGVTGEDISVNVRQIRSIPLRATLEPLGIATLEIRGEVVIHKKTFTAFNAQRVQQGLSPLANPRNAASGTLRMLDPAEVGRRQLSAVLYHIAYAQPLPGKSLPAELETHYDALAMLDRLGYPTPLAEMRVMNTMEEVIEFCADFEQRRDELPYEVDGLVIKVNSIALQEKLGMTSHHPRWAVAYKLAARQATSRLLYVDYQVGRTGNIGPVAKVEPVALSGVTISSISLFNEDVVREKDLRIGDVVLLERAGDVIPYIVKPLTDLRDGTEQPIVFPTHCPACHEALDKPEGDAAWRCINAACPAQTVERIIHFCSKNAMDIRGMGESNVQRFHDEGIIRTLPDLYNAPWERIAGLDRFGEKSIDNLRKAIEQSKTQPLHRLLFGLGIRHVGATIAKTLARHVSSLRDFYAMTEEELMALPDVGPKVAQSIAHFFANDENRAVVQALEDAGVSIVNTQRSEATGDGTLGGKTFLFTGTLSMKRADAEAMVEQKGGAILGSVSSKLNYLVAGEEAGSKLEKAKKLGSVRILTEAEFLELVSA